MALAATNWNRDTARAISQENVEIVRAALDAFNRGDWDSMLKDAAPQSAPEWPSLNQVYCLVRKLRDDKLVVKAGTGDKLASRS